MKENYKEQKESNRGDEAATYREDMLSRNDYQKMHYRWISYGNISHNGQLWQSFEIFN
jgi:hypothetical protein